MIEIINITDKKLYCENHVFRTMVIEEKSCLNCLRICECNNVDIINNCLETCEGGEK